MYEALRHLCGLKIRLALGGQIASWYQSKACIRPSANGVGGLQLLKLLVYAAFSYLQTPYGMLVPE
jgi:hypothetical protein